MYPSVNTPPDSLQPPPISSSPVKSSTTHNHNHSHHGSTLESNTNGRATNTGEPKPSSSSSPPKSQDFPSASFSNHTPNNGNSASTQPKSSLESRNKETPNHGGGSGGDAFLQWGQKKRSKRTVGDKFSGGRTMAPPPPPPGVGGRCGGGKVRTNNSNGVFSPSKDASSSLRNRMGSSGGGSGSGGGSPPSKNNQEGGNRPIASRSTVGKRSEKTDSKKHPSSSAFGGSIKKDKANDPLVHQSDHHHLTSPVRGGTPTEAEAFNKGGGGEVVEWPRIYIALSRKEKEDDYFSMKGTKLPHRPKKRAKAIDRTLQYCFPGMWLSDLSRARYEVRERKSAKKLKRRGLKGLDCVESDSE